MKNNPAELPNRPAYNKLPLHLCDKRILIVEDNHFNMELIVSILQRAGIKQIEYAFDGHEALEKAVQFMPELIILDLMMPNMDGFEFCKSIRKHSSFANTPIIVQTAMPSEEGRLKIFQYGANDLLRKPLTPNELIARISIHLEHSVMLDKLKHIKTTYDSEVSSALEMQQLLMPSAEDINAIEEAHNITLSPAFFSHAELGNAVWCIQPIDTFRFAIMYTRFKGLGISGAMSMFRFHSTLQTKLQLLSSPEQHIASIISDVEQNYPEENSPSMFCLLIDTADENVIAISNKLQWLFMFDHGRNECINFLDKSEGERIINLPFLKNDSLLLLDDNKMECDMFNHIFSVSTKEKPDFKEYHSSVISGIQATGYSQVSSIEELPSLLLCSRNS